MAVESRSNAKREEDLPTLPEVVEKVGFGWSQAKFILNGGGVWFADGSELLLISSVTNSLATEWHLDSMQRGAMVTIVFVGVLFGNLICGPISDRYGRRHLIIVSYAGIFVFSFVSSVATSFLTLGCWRFFVGLSFGLGQPPWNVLGAEVTPAKWRTFVNAVSQSLFAIGEMYSAMLIMLDDPNMENLHWRSLLRLGAIPSLIFGLASLAFLHQSPFFLAQQGQHDEASEVLKSMGRENCVPDGGPMRFRVVVQPAASQGLLGQCRSICRNSELLVSMLLLMYTCFVLNFVYYGSLYAFPQILPTLHGSATHLHQSASMELVVGALWELPGIAIGCFFGMYVKRIPVMKLYCLLLTSMLIMFAGSATAGGHSTLHVILYHIGYYGIKSFVMIGFVVVYIYVCEVYPTAVRGTGTGIAIATGRLGATIAPMFYEKITEMSGTFSTFFYIGAALCIVNLFLIDFLPYDTYDSALKEIIEDEEVPSYGGVPEMSGSSHRL